MSNEYQTIIIRLAVEDDFKDIYTIWIDGIENSFEASTIDQDIMQKKFESNFRLRYGIFNFWVAVDEDNTILGWQSLIKASNNPFRENKYAESSTYILRKTRDKGIGKLLLDYAMKEAENSDLEYIIGFVSLTNNAAMRITKETGWIEVGQIPHSQKGNNKFIKTFLIRPV